MLTFEGVLVFILFMSFYGLLATGFGWIIITGSNTLLDTKYKRTFGKCLIAGLGVLLAVKAVKRIF